MRTDPIDYMVTRGVLTQEQADALSLEGEKILMRAFACGYSARAKKQALLVPTRAGEMELDDAIEMFHFEQVTGQKPGPEEVQR